MSGSNAEKILHLMHKLKKTGVVSKVMGDIGLSQGEFMMLRLIKCHTYDKESVTVSALSEQLKVSRSAVSQMINAVEDKGLAERAASKSDRRLVYVKLTPLGTETVEKGFAAFLKVINDVLNEMGDKDANHLIALLGKLYTIAENYDYDKR